MACSLRLENQLRRQGHHPAAGIDEAGRGPLAGPVVAAAVILPQRYRRGALDDSKKLTEQAREEIYARLTEDPRVIYSVAEVSPREIDSLNILRGTHLAMRRALLRLRVKAVHALIDGLPVEPFPVPQTAVVKGDGKCLTIAAAGVIAKVTRDRLMVRADRLYPHYGFARHKGYCTPEHLAALHTHGPCPIHRRSFEPVAQGFLPLEDVA